MRKANIVAVFISTMALSGCGFFDPPPEQLAVGVHAPCVVTVDGEQVSFTLLGARLTRWTGADRPRVRFAPDPDADFDCVTRVLQILDKSVPTSKLTILRSGPSKGR